MKNLALTVCLSLALSSAAAADKKPADAQVTPMTPDVVKKYDRVLPDADFKRRVAMIPMRDGVKLYTVIVMKKGTNERADPAVAHAVRRESARPHA